MSEKKLSNLKVGDEVLYIGGSYMTKYEKIVKIIKITPTGRFRIDYNPEVQFNQQGFEMIKIDSWGTTRARIVPLTEEKREKLRKLAVIRKANKALETFLQVLIKTNNTNLDDNYASATAFLAFYNTETEKKK